LITREEKKGETKKVLRKYTHGGKKKLSDNTKKKNNEKKDITKDFHMFHCTD